MKHEQEKEPTTEETKEDDEEDDRNSQDSGFIPDKIDKEEQKRSTLPLDTEEKREEEVRVEGDGQTKEDEERPGTVIVSVCFLYFVRR